MLLTNCFWVDPILTGMRPTIMETSQIHETESSEYKDDYDELTSNEKKNIFPIN